MTDENGVNVPTNKPEEDPDIPGIGYYGSKWRDSSATWASQDRASHFSSWARRGIISDRLATAILRHAGRVALNAGGIIDSIRGAPVIAFRCRSHRRHSTALLPCQRVRGKPESTGMVSQWRQGQKWSAMRREPEVRQ